MWKRLLIVTAALLVILAGLVFYLSNEIYLRHDHETVGEDQFDALLTANQIGADVDYLIAKLKKIHPSFERVGGATLERRARQLVGAIDQPMTRTDMYRQLAPLNGALSDGHTSLRAPREEYNAYLAGGGRLVPFTASLGQDGLVIDRVLVGGSGMQQGDSVLAINGVAGAELAEFSLASQSGESAELRRAYAQRFFARDVWAAGVTSPFSISLSREGRALDLDDDGLTRAEYLERRDEAPAQENSYRLVRPGVGLLTFNVMPPADSGFREFLQTTFAEIRNEGVRRLVLDIRENGGGDSRAGDALMAYLSATDLPAIEYVDVKVTQEIKAYYETLLPRGFRWIPLHRFVEVLGKIKSTLPGETFRLHPDAAEPVAWDERPREAFDGELIVLIGPRTYSSAVIFAAPLKHFGRAVFVGQETGEPLIFFGENYYFDLPNSKLEAQVSHKKFVLVGASDERTGIVPDHVVEDGGQSALQVALALENP